MAAPRAIRILAGHSYPAKSMMPGRLTRPGALAAGLVLLAAIAHGQEAAPKATPEIAGPPAPKLERTPPAPVVTVPIDQIDARFRSPRATVRTFLTAMNLLKRNSKRLEDAVACLDLSGRPKGHLDAGRLAYEMELLIEAIGIPTAVIPDEPEGAEFRLGESKDLQILLRRHGDGRWLFDSETVKALPRLSVAVHSRNLAAPDNKEATDVPTAYRTPRAVWLTYLNAIVDGKADRAADCLDLSSIPAPAQDIVGRQLARQLKEILDRYLYIIYQDVPDTPYGDPVETLVSPEGRVLVERQSTGPRKGQWLFDQTTVESIESLYDAFEDRPIVPELKADALAGPPTFRAAPSLWLRDWMPDILRGRLGVSKAISVELYQLLGLIVVALASSPVYRLALGLAVLAGRSLFRWRREPVEPGEIGRFAHPIAALAVITFLVNGIAILGLRHQIAIALLTVLVPLHYFAWSLTIYRLIDPLLKLVAGPSNAANPDMITLAAMGFPIVSLVLKIVVVVYGIATVLDLFDFDIGTILAGLGIGGLAFALAAQDTLKNLFGSVMLIADRTFRVGDLVKLGENEGVVETVGVRSTRIRCLDDSLLTIPNSDLMTSHLTNFGARRARRFRTQLTLPYGMPADRLVAFRDGILELIRRNPRMRSRMCEVVLTELGHSGPELLIQIFLDVADGHAELLAREEFILEILRLAETLDIAPLAPARTSDLMAGVA